MAKCKLCGKSGLLLHLTKNGVCSRCDQILQIECPNDVRILNDCVRIISESSNVDTIRSRISVLVDCAQRLYRFEQKGIRIMDPPPSYYLSADFDELIVKGLERELQKLQEKLLGLKTTKAKTSAVEKYRLKLKEYVQLINNQLLLTILDQKALYLLPEVGVVDNPTSPVLANPSHPAQLILKSSGLPGSSSIFPSIRIDMNISSSQPKASVIPPDDPSIVYGLLPIVKPKDPFHIENPDYFPSYARLTPQQRWVYLNWLTDISQPVNISYVFIYYYGLERQLLSGKFDQSFDEIIYLRNIHTNTSFQNYSANALIYGCLINKSTDRLLTDVVGCIRTVNNDALLVAHLCQMDLTPQSMILAAKKIPGINRRYIDAHTDFYCQELTEVLQERYGVAYFPFAAKFSIQECPKVNTVLFANFSFPSELRTAEVPNFLAHPKFIPEIQAVYADAHQRTKEKLKSSK